MAISKLAAVLLPSTVWFLLIISCRLPWGESRTIAPRWGDDDDVVLIAANGTQFNIGSDAWIDYDCDGRCNDKKCNKAYPKMCEGVKPGGMRTRSDDYKSSVGVDDNDQYEYYTCWVGCWCADSKCYCLCRKEES